MEGMGRDRCLTRTASEHRGEMAMSYKLVPCVTPRTAGSCRDWPVPRGADNRNAKWAYAAPR